MIWQPMSEDASILELRLAGAVRAMIANDPEGRQGEPPWQALALEGGQTLRVRISAIPVRRVRHGLRSALFYEVSGQAVIGQDGFACTGSATLDLKTRAFLDVNCALSPLGALSPR